MRSTRLTSVPLLAACLLCLAPLLPAPAAAFDFVVTRYDDPPPDGCVAGDCSLREAVIDANALTNPDRIILSAGTYRLTIVGTNEDGAANGDLDVENDLEILGVGASMTRLDSSGTGEATLHADAPGVDFTLRKVTVQRSDSSALTLGGGRHTIEDCELRDSGGSGVFASTGSHVEIRRSTMAGNAFNGLFVGQGSAALENCTISGNGGPDVASTSAQISCSHCTIVDIADSDPEISMNNSTFLLANSIVAGNCGFANGGSVDSRGGNIESTGDTCGFDETSDVVGVSGIGLHLDPLADNGAGTRTHMPLFLSPANGGANDALCLPEDQRGVARTTDCESGAVERTGAAVPSAILVDGFEQGNTGAWTTVP